MRIDNPKVDDSHIVHKGDGTVEIASKTNSFAHITAHENRHIARKKEIEKT